MLKARFFDGVSSQPKQVQVDFQQHELVFEFVDGDGLSTTLCWSAGQISHEKHSGGSLRKIIHDSNELVFLELADQNFLQLDNWMEAHSVSRKKFALFMNRGIVLGILIMALAIFPLFYFFGIPLITDYAAQHVPVEIEQKMGREMASSILATSVEDKKRSALADSMVQCLNKQFRIPVSIHVIKSDELNAFALPGGEIFVYSAMLDACKTKEEFTALLGHEIGHVQLRHTTKSVLRAMIGSILFSIVVSDYNGVAGVAADQAAQLKDLSYSRELESEADSYSINLLSQNHLNPKGLIKLFKVFQEEENENGYSIPVFLSSHPLTKDRISAAGKEIAAIPVRIHSNEKLSFYFNQLKY